QSSEEGGMVTIGLLHPGEMGASVGRAARATGHRVLWASHGRGPDTAARAAGAGLEDAGTLHALASASDVILSVCPPHAAVDVAPAFAAANLPDGFHRAAGEVYRRLSPYKDAGVPPTIEDVAKTLRKEPRP